MVEPRGSKLFPLKSSKIRRFRDVAHAMYASYVYHRARDLLPLERLCPEPLCALVSLGHEIYRP
jgi:hypothetical protein